MINKNSIYYLVAIILFIVLKFAFAAADTDNLTFLLGPVNKIVQLVTGSHSVYITGNGYYHNELNVLINKSCSGFNFFLLSFLMIVFRSVIFLNKQFHKTLLIPAGLITAYLLAIFVNSSRIIASICFQKHANTIFPDSHSIVHESIGVITNLSFLILIYYLTEKLLTNKLNHAQPA